MKPSIFSINRRFHNLAALCAISLIVAVSATAPTDAVAGDRKIYTGSSCLPYFDRDSGLLQRYKDRIFNTSYTTAVWVACPVLRDNTGNTDGNKSVYVYGSRSPRGVSFHCNFYNNNVYYGTAYQKGVGTYASGYFRLNLTLGKTQRQGDYALLCRINPRSGLAKYEIDEK